MPVPASDPPPARAPKVTRGPVPGAEKATPAPHPGAEQAAPPRGRRTAAIAVASVIGTAIAGAAATALITSERVDQFFGILGGAAAGQVASETKPLEYKTVTDGDRALSSRYLRTGSSSTPATTLCSAASASRALRCWPATASATAATGASPRSTSERPPRRPRGTSCRSRPRRSGPVLSALAAEYDWSIDQCLHSTDELAPPTGFVGVSTSWDDWAQTDGMRVWEIYASSDDGAVFLFVQVFLPPGADASVAHHLAETLTVTKSEVPGSTGGASVGP